MQASPDPGLLAALLPLLRPLSHLRWHPLRHPRQLQTGSCTPRWVVNLVILPLLIFSILRDLSRALLLRESEQRWCSKGKGEQIPQMRKVDWHPRRTTPTLRCGWLEKAGSRGDPSSPQISSLSHLSQSWSRKSWNAAQQKGDHCSQGKEYRFVLFGCSNSSWQNEILKIVQDTEPRVSAWFNRPLSSCKRRQGEAHHLYLVTLPKPFLPVRLFPCPDCPVPEGFTARVMPLQILPLSPGFSFTYRWFKTAVSHPSKKELISTMPNFLLFRLNKKEVTFTSVVEDIWSCLPEIYVHVSMQLINIVPWDHPKSNNISCLHMKARTTLLDLSYWLRSNILILGQRSSFCEISLRIC